MTGIDKLNLVCTIISIVVTIVSIGFSIWACYSAKKAKRYREETSHFVQELRCGARKRATMHQQSDSERVKRLDRMTESEALWRVFRRKSEKVEDKD